MQNAGFASPHGSDEGEGGGDGGDGGGDGGGGGGGGGRPGQKLQVPLQFSTNKGFLHLFDFSVKPRQSTGSASPHGSGEGEGEGGGGGGDRVQSESCSSAHFRRQTSVSRDGRRRQWPQGEQLSWHFRRLRRQGGNGGEGGAFEGDGEGRGSTTTRGGGGGGGGGGFGDGGEGEGGGDGECGNAGGLQRTYWLLQWATASTMHAAGR